jgi:hypothetical protein
MGGTLKRSGGCLAQIVHGSTVEKLSPGGNVKLVSRQPELLKSVYRAFDLQLVKVTDECHPCAPVLCGGLLACACLGKVLPDLVQFSSVKPHAGTTRALIHLHLTIPAEKAALQLDVLAAWTWTLSLVIHDHVGVTDGSQEHVGFTVRPVPESFQLKRIEPEPSATTVTYIDRD